jgi:transposase-like protein
VVFRRLRYRLSLRDLPEMFLIRGIEFSYEAVRDWEAKLTPSLIESLSGSAKAGLGEAGTWTRRTSRCKAAGATSIEPSIALARWST